MTSRYDLRIVYFFKLDVYLFSKSCKFWTYMKFNFDVKLFNDTKGWNFLNRHCYESLRDSMRACSQLILTNVHNCPFSNIPHLFIWTRCIIDLLLIIHYKTRDASYRCIIIQTQYQIQLLTYTWVLRVECVWDLRVCEGLCLMLCSDDCALSIFATTIWGFYPTLCSNRLNFYFYLFPGKIRWI